MLPKASAYVKSYDSQTIWIYFLIENDDLLEKINIIWDKIEKEFDGEPVYNKELSESKIKSYGDEVADLYDKEVPIVDSNFTCLLVIRLDSALLDQNYYPQVFLKEYKYIKKEVVRHITKDIEILSDESNESDEE